MGENCDDKDFANANEHSTPVAAPRFSNVVRQRVPIKKRK
jgi:hypothetical protein